jgi:hypothetical protein
MTIHNEERCGNGTNEDNATQEDFWEWLNTSPVAWDCNTHETDYIVIGFHTWNNEVSDDNL